MSLSVQSRHSSYKNELATVLIVMVSDHFFPFDDLGVIFFPAIIDVLVIIFIPIIHTILLSASQFFTAI